MGERLIVQFAKGSRREQPFAQQERPIPRPRRTPFRMTLSGLSADTSWQVRSPFATTVLFLYWPTGTADASMAHLTSGSLVPHVSLASPYRRLWFSFALSI